MDDESFIGAFGDVPTDLAGDYGQLYILRAEDFGAWYRRVRDAHEREVDGGVDAMTDAQLADHGLCRIGSAAMWDEVRDTKDRELSEEHGLVRVPVDADGVPIHVGDVLTDGEYTFRVDELAVFGDGSWSIRNEDGNAWAACDVTHHHESTVETTVGTTLQKLLEQAVGYSDAHTTVALNAIAEYAAKLRLADDGEEEW